MSDIDAECATVPHPPHCPCPTCTMERQTEAMMKDLRERWAERGRKRSEFYRKRRFGDRTVATKQEDQA